MGLNIEEGKLKTLIERGLSIREISEEFGVNISTIKRRMSEYGLKSNFYNTKNEDLECLCCGKKFKSLKKQNRLFCSRSCSVALNNKITKVKKDPTPKKCLNCEVEISKNSKYCSNKCQQHYQINLRISEGASEHTMRKFLIKTYGAKCMECGWDKVSQYTGKVPIEMEHIDGDAENNQLSNLKLLCPNCHSLTSTYKALNKGRGRNERKKYRESIKKLTIEELIKEKENI
jgi:hypothetical protein